MTVSLYQNRYFFPNIKVSFQKKKACSVSRVFAACKGPGESPERPFPAGACAVPAVSEGRQPVGVRVSGKVCPVRGTAEVSLTPSARQQDGLPGADAAGQAPSPQNHRIVGVGRDLWGSSGPTPLPRQGHPEQAAQDLVQGGLEYLQRRRYSLAAEVGHRCGVKPHCCGLVQPVC